MLPRIINDERKEMCLFYDFVFLWILNDNSLFPPNILLKHGSQSIVRDDGRSLECSKYSGPLCCAKRSHNQGLPLHTITTHNHPMPSSNALRVLASGRHFFADILAFNEVLTRWQCDGWEMYQHYLPSLSRLYRFNILKPRPNIRMEPALSDP